MPASNINSYLQDARNNFDAIRPVPVCPDANQLMGQYQNAHISANCYYGYQDVKNPGASEVNHVDMDCEMMELEDSAVDNTVSKPLPKKRSADDLDCPRTKRLKEDVSSICSLVGTRSSPSHSASAFNVNTSEVYTIVVKYRWYLTVYNY